MTTDLSGQITSNDIYAFELSGNVTLKIDESTFLLDNSFDAIELDYQEADRTGVMIGLTNKSYYIIIEHDINNSVNHTQTNTNDSSDNNYLDDAWGLNEISFNVPKEVLYDPSTIRKLPVIKSDSSNVCLAYIPVNYYDISNLIDYHNTPGRIDVKSSVSSTEQGKYNTDKADFNFSFGVNITDVKAIDPLHSLYLLDERVSKYQIAGYKKKNTTDVSYSNVQLYLQENSIDLTDAETYSSRDDILMGLIQLDETQATGCTFLNLNILKKWYDTELDNIVSYITNQNTIDSVFVTLNKVETESNNRLSSLARTRMTVDVNTGKNVWIGRVNDSLTKLFAEGDYVILTSSFNYAPKLTDSNDTDNIFETVTTDCLNNVFVVLKQTAS